MKQNVRWEMVFVILIVGIFSVLVAHLINFSSNSLTGFAVAGMTEGPVGSQSYLNCTVDYNTSCSDGFYKILSLYNYTNSHAGLANTTGFNYSLCCGSTTAGVVLNYTNSSSDNSTYFNFLNLFQMNNSHVALPNATFMHDNNGSNYTIEYLDPYTIPAIISTSVGTITCNYYENYYGNCSLETEACLVTVPFNMTGNYTNLHVADCNYSSAYDTSICCDLTPTIAEVYINGTFMDPNNGANITYAGMPVNLTVKTALIGGKILVYEYNGYTFSTLPQYALSNVSTQGIGEIDIRSESTELTIIPTGGPVSNEDEIGEYYIEVIVQNSGGSTVFTQRFNVTNRDLVDPSGQLALPNVNNVRGNVQDLYSAYSYAQAWINAGGGVNRHLFINGSNNVIGNDFILRATEPTGLNIQVWDNNTDSPMNAIIKFVETNGYSMFALPQYTISNVTSIAMGVVNTTSNGIANVTIIQTGGPVDNEDEIGNFTVRLEIYNRTNHFINEVNITVNRTIVSPGTTETIPNQQNVAGNLQDLYSTYSFAQGWLNQ